LAAHPDAVRRYRYGKHGVLGFLVGEALRAADGHGDPARWRELLRAALERS
jgi:Asp-tRNA(Asn)/Glu-tRNA(Gln) amidotransferase B subunit